MKIFKYEVTRGKKVVLPKGAEIVHFGKQGETLFVWAMFDDEAVQGDRERSLHVVGTGQSFPYGWRHRGTIFDGVFVWHLMEGADPS